MVDILIALSPTNAWPQCFLTKFNVENSLGKIVIVCLEKL